MIFPMLILIVPLIITVFVLMAFILIVLGLWEWSLLLSVCAVLLNWCSETYALHLFKRNVINYDFRVLSFNINRAYEHSVNKGTTEDLIDLILRQDADIILLQEYNSEIYSQIQDRLVEVYPYGNGEDGHSRYKSCFSRYQILSCEQLVHEGDLLPICRMIFDMSGRKLQLFNCHLQSNNYSVGVRNLKNKKTGLLKTICQIFQSLYYGYQNRKMQVKVLNSYMGTEYPTVVCGDFNDISGSKTLRLLQSKNLSNAWWKGGYGFGFTFHGMRLRFRLDHALYSPISLCLANVFIPHSDVSDHYPLVCDFIFKKDV